MLNLNLLGKEILFSILFFAEDKIVIIWQSNPDFLHPSNLVIYNADTSINKIISVPKFIGSAKTDEGYTDKKKIGNFQNIKGNFKIDGIEYLLVNISSEAFHVRWGDCLGIEVRALDINSGKFHPKYCEDGIYW